MAESIEKEEQWENPTLDNLRRVMSLVFKSGMRCGLIPRDEASNPLRFVRCKTTSEYEALILAPKQAFDLLMALPEHRAHNGNLGRCNWTENLGVPRTSVARRGLLMTPDLLAGSPANPQSLLKAALP